MLSRSDERNDASNLRARVAQLRRELTDTTKAYRLAVQVRDSSKTIPLLRSRSKLMRELLETQCELLLCLRADPESPPKVSEDSPSVPADAIVAAPQPGATA